MVVATGRRGTLGSLVGRSKIGRPDMTTMTTQLGRRHQQLDATVAVMRRRLLLIGGGTALCWAVAAGLALLITAAWLDLALDFAGAVRAILDVAIFAGGIAVAGYFYTRAYRSATFGEIARTLDNAANAR